MNCHDDVARDITDGGIFAENTKRVVHEPVLRQAAFAWLATALDAVPEGSGNYAR